MLPVDIAEHKMIAKALLWNQLRSPRSVDPGSSLHPWKTRTPTQDPLPHNCSRQGNSLALDQDPMGALSIFDGLLSLFSRLMSVLFVLPIDTQKGKSVQSPPYSQKLLVMSRYPWLPLESYCQILTGYVRLCIFLSRILFGPVASANDPLLGYWHCSFSIEHLDLVLLMYT